MNFSAWSIRNPIAPILAFFMLMVLGWQSFNALPITRFPNIDVPLVAVTRHPVGRRPGRAGSAGHQGDRGCRRRHHRRQEHHLDRDRRRYRPPWSSSAWKCRPTRPCRTSRTRSTRSVGDLPGDVEAPIVTRIDVEGQAIMTFAVSAPDMSMEELSWFVDDTITRALQGRPASAGSTAIGGADREIRVELDPVKLDSFGITAAGGERAAARDQHRPGRGPGADRHERAGDPHAGRRGDGRKPGRDHHRPALGPLRAAGRSRRGGRHLRGAAVVLAHRTASRSSPSPVFRAKGASEVSVAEIGQRALDEIRAEQPRRGDHAGRRHGVLHLRQLRGRDPHADRRRASGRARGAGRSCGTGARR